MQHLSVCTKVAGDHFVSPGQPGIMELSDAVYMPFVHNGNYGIFDSAGTAVTAALNFRGHERRPIRQPLQLALPDLSEVPVEGNFIYLGTMFGHFGHFITTTLSRFWYLCEHSWRPDTIFLYHDAVEPHRFFLQTHMAQIFGSLDLGPQNFRRFLSPTILRGSLHIPFPSFSENYMGQKAYRDCARMFGERIMGAAPPAAAAPLYISKTRLHRGLRRFVNEAELEDELAARGVFIFHPEVHPFDEQLRVLASHSRIISSVGSALHTTVFLPSPRHIIGLNDTNSLNSNFLILDELVGNSAVYVHACESAEESDDEGFKRSFRLRNPRAVARELLDLAC